MVAAADWLQWWYLRWIPLALIGVPLAYYTIGRSMSEGIFVSVCLGGVYLLVYRFIRVGRDDAT